MDKDISKKDISLSIAELFSLTAVRIRQMKTKIKVEFPKDHPFKEDISTILRRFETVRCAA